MTLQLVSPRARGLICTNAHPEGCAKNVVRQIAYARNKISGSGSPMNVLVIGASTGYGLASRIVSSFGYGAKTVGVFFERAPENERTGSAGYYNCVSFHEEAKRSSLYARSINGDAFSDEIKERTFRMIRDDLGKLDYVIYSLASPRRLHPRTKALHQSVIKPVGRSFEGKGVDLNTGRIQTIVVQPASENEVADTQAVMGGEDWGFWIEGLLRENLLNPGARTLAYSYIGPEQTWPIYRSGTIGKAKDHLECTARQLDLQMQKALGGGAWVAINKAVVTQASAAIPVVPLYLALLYRIMKEEGTHEDCIEQMVRLFADHIGPGRSPTLDAQRRIRLDDLEMRPGIQRQITRIWTEFREGEEIPEFASYKQDFLRLFGFEILGVDYSASVDIDRRWESDDPKQEALAASAPIEVRNSKVNPQASRFE